MLLDQVFQKSNVSLVRSKQQKAYHSLILYDSWICDEGFFRGLDTCYEEYRLSKTKKLECCITLVI